MTTLNCGQQKSTYSWGNNQLIFLEFVPFLSSKRSRGKAEGRGFTLTEVMISGVLVTMLMTAMGQILTSSLAGSSQISSRRRIEHAIEDNIHALHQADVNLTNFLKLDKKKLEEACLSPTIFLANELAREESVAFVEEPQPHRSISSETIRRTITANPDNGITKVSYQFKGPEQSIDLEHRIVELNPNFQSSCNSAYAATETTTPSPLNTTKTVRKQRQRKCTTTRRNKGKC